MTSSFQIIIFARLALMDMISTALGYLIKTVLGERFPLVTVPRKFQVPLFYPKIRHRKALSNRIGAIRALAESGFPSRRGGDAPDVGESDFTNGAWLPGCLPHLFDPDERVGDSRGSLSSVAKGLGAEFLGLEESSARK